jgi:hypothetical protein
MTGALRAQKLDAESWHTGGGCWVSDVALSDGTHILVSDMVTVS